MKTETTLVSGAGLRLLIAEMNPRVRRLLNSITIDWCPAYLLEHERDYRQLEKLGLIELEKAQNTRGGDAWLARRTMRESK